MNSTTASNKLSFSAIKAKFGNRFSNKNTPKTNVKPGISINDLLDEIVVPMRQRRGRCTSNGSTIVPQARNNNLINAPYHRAQSADTVEIPLSIPNPNDNTRENPLYLYAPESSEDEEDDIYFYLESPNGILFLSENNIMSLADDFSYDRHSKIYKLLYTTVRTDMLLFGMLLSLEDLYTICRYDRLDRPVPQSNSFRIKFPKKVTFSSILNYKTEEGFEYSKDESKLAQALVYDPLYDRYRLLNISEARELSNIDKRHIFTPFYTIVELYPDTLSFYNGISVEAEELVDILKLSDTYIYCPQGNEFKITQRVIKRTSYRKGSTGINSCSKPERTSSKNEDLKIKRDRIDKFEALVRPAIYGQQPYIDFSLKPQMNPFGLPVNFTLDEDLNDTLTQISKTFTEGINIKHSVDQNTINLVDKIANIFSNPNIDKKLKVDIGLSSDTIKKTGFIAAILAAALYHANVNTNESLAILTSIFGIGVLTQGLIVLPNFSELGMMLSKYIREFTFLKPQMNKDTLDTIINSIVMIFTSHLVSTSNAHWMPTLFSQISNFKKNHDSFSSCITAVIKIFELIFNFVSRDILGGSTYSFLESNRKDVNEFLKKVNKLSDDLHHNKFPFTRDNATLIHQMWIDCRSLVASIPKGEDNGIILALNNACQYLYSQKKIFDGMNLTLTGSRIEPTSALFLGPPGTGKSNLLYPLAYTLLMKILPLEKISQFKADPNSFIYNRQPETVYWDGYDMDKLVCFIDDLGQLRDIAGNPDNEWMNWIRMCSSFEYVLHMAALEKKGNVRFQSRFVFANSNLKAFNVESIVEIEAFERRVDHCFICVPKIEFCKPDTVSGSIWGRRLDGTKLPIGALGITDMTPNTTEFIEYDTLKRCETGRILSFHDVVQILLDNANLKKLRYDQTQVNLSNIIADNDIKSQMDFEFKDPDIKEFIRNIENNPEGKNIMLTLYGYFNYIFGYTPNITNLLTFFKNWKGEDFIQMSTLSQAENEEARDNMFDILSDMVDFDFSQYLPKIKSPKPLDRLIKAFETVYTKIENFIKASGNQLMIHAQNIMEWCINDLSLMGKIVSIFVATGAITYISTFFWEKVGPIFGQSYSGKPQRDRTTKTARKAVSSKDMRARLGHISQPQPSVQSSGKYDMSNASIVTKIIKRNCYELWLPDQDAKVGTITFLKGRTFMMPKHFANEIYSVLEDYPKYEDKLVTFKKAGSKVIYQCKMIDMLNIVSSTDLDSLDVVFVQAPVFFPVHADITRYFLTRDQVAKYKIIDYRLVLPGVEGFESWMGKAYPTNSELISGDISYVLSKGFRYTAMTKVGDCGGLFTLIDNYSGCGKLLGIHVAGVTNLSLGIASCITYEDVSSNVPKDEIQYDFEDDAFPQMQKIVLDGRFSEKYHHKFSASSASVTKIVKSPLHNMWGPALTAPAKLRPFISVELGDIDPYSRALSKYCLPFKYIEPSYITDVGNNVFDNIVKRSKVEIEPRLLSFDESILGIEEEPDFGAISRTTSLGFPDNALPGKKSKGKSAYFGTEQEYDITNENAIRLIDECKAIEKLADQRIRSEHIYTDCLKDERRPIDKVKIGKTRLFSSCPVRLLILFRRYFGTFTLWCHKNRIENGFAVGVNPYSTEWQLIAEKLLRFGDKNTRNVGAGDYESYDGSLKASIMWDILRHINEWYNDDFSHIREILFIEIVNSNHVIGNEVYMWDSSNPSGQPLTTLVNNIYNHYVANYVWYKSHDFDLVALSQFYNHVTYITLGDDNIFSVSSDKTSKFNESMMAKYCPDLGMKYTSETKGVINENMRRITEVSFLKRSFRYEPLYDRYCAPLELSVVLEIPYWITSGPDPDSRVHENVSTTMKELALHDPTVFDHYSQLIIGAYKRRMNASPDDIRRNVLLKKLEGCTEWY